MSLPLPALLARGVLPIRPVIAGVLGTFAIQVWRVRVLHRVHLDSLPTINVASRYSSHMLTPSRLVANPNG